MEEDDPSKREERIRRKAVLAEMLSSPSTLLKHVKTSGGGKTTYSSTTIKMSSSDGNRQYESSSYTSFESFGDPVDEAEVERKRMRRMKESDKENDDIEALLNKLGDDPIGGGVDIEEIIGEEGDIPMEECDFGYLLDNSAAKHKIDVRKKVVRKGASSSGSSSFTEGEREIKRGRMETEESQSTNVGGSGRTSITRRRSSSLKGKKESGGSTEQQLTGLVVLKELIETEEEYVGELTGFVNDWIKGGWVTTPGIETPFVNVWNEFVKEDIVEKLFKNYLQIWEFHKGVLLEGLSCYGESPRMVAKTFSRLERDWDRCYLNYPDHLNKIDHLIQDINQQDSLRKSHVHKPPLSNVIQYVDSLNSTGVSFFDYLKLPLQRLQDYNILITELTQAVKSESIKKKEDSTLVLNDLKKCFELVEWLPYKSRDLEFIRSIEGGGEIDCFKLGRILLHDWFGFKGSEESGGVEKTRYCFLFGSGKLLVTKVKKVTNDRSIFILKDWVDLPEWSLKEAAKGFELDNDKRKYEFAKCESTVVTEGGSGGGGTVNDWTSEIRRFSKTQEEADAPQSDRQEKAPPSSASSALSSAVEFLEKQVEEVIKKEADKKVEEPVKPKQPAPEVKAVEKEPPKKVEKSEEEAAAPKIQKREEEPAKSNVKAEIEPAKLTETPEKKPEKSIHKAEPEPVKSTPKAESEPVKPIEEIQPTVPTVEKKLSAPIIEEKVNSPKEPETKETIPAPAQEKPPSAATVKEPQINPDSLAAKKVDYKKKVQVEKIVTSEVESPTATKTESESKPEVVAKGIKESDLRAEDASKKTKPTEKTTKPTDVATKETKKMDDDSGAPPPGALLRRKSSVILLRRDSQELPLAGSAAAGESGNNGGSNNGPPPVILQGIRSVEVEPGESAIFTCRVKPPTGENTPPSVIWLKSNRPLDDKLADRVKIVQKEDFYSLELQNVRVEDGGLYVARSTNPCNGASVTCSAVLNVHEFTAEERMKKKEDQKPHFTVRLKDSDLLLDTNVSFLTQVQAGDIGGKKQDINVKFYKDGKELKKDGDRVDIHGPSPQGTWELIINHVSENDAGEYKAVAKSSGGDTCECLANVTVTSEKDIFGSVGASLLQPGEEPIFTWFRDGRIWDNEEERFRVLFKDDEDSLALLFQHVKPEDAGLYTCVASTSSGRISCSAELTVQGAVHQLLREPEPPIVTMELSPVTEVGMGGSAMLECKIRGFPKPSVEWTRPDGVINAGGRYRFLFEDDESMALIIKQVDLKDAGEYVVKASNDLGQCETRGTLAVKSPPRFKRKMVDMAVMTDEKVDIRVEVEGCPVPEIKWYKDGQLVLESSRVKFTQDGPDKFTLIIEKVRLEDAGAWSVVATNPIGSMSEFFNLTAQKKPKFIKKLESTYEAEISKSTTFEFEYVGVPKPDFEFNVNETKVTEEIIKKSSTEYKYEATSVERTIDSVKETVICGKLTINKVTREMDGGITLKIKNQFGEEQCKSEMRVKRPPVFKARDLGNVCIKKGETVNYEVECDVYPVPTDKSKVKWFIDSVEIDSTKYPTAITSPPCRLKFSHSDISQDCTIKLRMENEYGSDEISGKVTVKCPPVFTKALPPTYVLIESEVIKKGFKIEVGVSGVPEPKLKWFHDGKELTETTANIKIKKESQETWSLAFDVCKPADWNGDWTVTATNELGEISTKTNITVEVSHLELLEKGQISQMSSEMEEMPIVSSEREPSVSPQKAELSVTPQKHELTASSVGIQESKSVDNLLARAQNARNETYGIIEQNGKVDEKPQYGTEMETSQEIPQTAAISEVGDDKQEPALDVCAPSIVDGLPTTLQAIESEQVKTIVKFIANPPVNAVKWSLDGVELQPTSNYVINTDTKPDTAKKSSITTAELTINSLDLNSKSIKCEAVNKHGSVMCETSLKTTSQAELFQPRLSNALVDMVKVEGEKGVIIPVELKGKEPFDVTWSQDGKVVDKAKKSDGNLKIEKIEKKHDGDYELQVENPYGKCGGKFHLKVEYPPEMVEKFSENLQVAPGEKGSLTAKIDANPPLEEIKCTIDGKEVESGKLQVDKDGNVTNIKLNIDVPHDEKRAAVKCKLEVKNKHGKGETMCDLKFKTSPPSIHPVNFEKHVQYPEGDTMKFKARIEGAPTPTVAWLKDGKPLEFEPARMKCEIVDENGNKYAVLTISDCKPTDKGVYTLKASNSAGEEKFNINADVLATPKGAKIIKLTASANEIEFKGDLKLVAEISGFPAPKIEWFKDGGKLVSSGNVEIGVDDKGETILGKVEILGVDGKHTGTYSVSAKNNYGEDEKSTDVVVLPKKSKPSFSIGSLGDVRVVESYPLIFASVVIKAYPPPKIEWIHEKLGPDSSSKTTLLNLETMETILSIPKSTLNHAGKWTLKATNDEGTAEIHGNAQVIGLGGDGEMAPEYGQFPSEHEGDEDGSVQLVLKGVKGAPLPSIKWFKDGMEIDVAKDPTKYQVLFDGENATLKINNLSLSSDAGNYSCTLTNPFGTTTAHTSLKIRKIYFPPKFTQKFTDVQQMAGWDAKFGAKFDANPPPTIRWFKDGEFLDFDKNPGLSKKYKVASGGNAASLTVCDCGDADLGVYKCEISNREGKDECQAVLEIVDNVSKIGRREPPYFLKTIGDTEVYQQMTGKFTACIGGSPEPEFEWFFKQRGDDEWRKVYATSLPAQRIRCEREGVGLLRLIINHITEADCGIYKLRIWNELGECDCEGTLKFESLDPRLKPLAPTGDQYMDYDKFASSRAPVALPDRPTILRLRDTDLTLAWKPHRYYYNYTGAGHHQVAPPFPVTYVIEMAKVPASSSDSSSLVWNVYKRGIKGCVCDVIGLEPAPRDYKFRIRVENEAGMSEPSPYVATGRSHWDLSPWRWSPLLQPSIPRDYDLDRPPHPNYIHAPRFLNPEYDYQYGLLNVNTRLNWKLYGYPRPEVEFFRGDEKITSDSEGAFQTGYTSNGDVWIYIRRMTPVHVGPYEVVARNPHGIARQIVNLRIAEAPYFIQRLNGPLNIMQYKGGKLTAIVKGTPMPDFKWYKDWRLLGESSRIKMSVLDAPRDMYENDTWIVSMSLSESGVRDSGLYTLLCKNVAGWIHSSVYVTVEESEHDYLWNSYIKSREIRLRPFGPKVTDYYDLGHEIGRGTQSWIMHCCERGSGSNYAAKTMIGRGKYYDWMKNEFDIWNGLCCERICRVVDAFETGGYAPRSGMVLITELATGGDIFKYYENLTKSYAIRYEDECDFEFSEYRAAFFTRQILEALDYLHTNSIAHLGLTPLDVLFSHHSTLNLKLIDFGLARRITNKLYPLEYGHPHWISPEIARNANVGLHSDMWSLGVFVHLLLTGRVLYQGDNDRECIQWLRDMENSWRWSSNHNSSWYSHLSSSAQDFLSKILVFGSMERIDVRTALNHPWIRQTYREFNSKMKDDAFELYLQSKDTVLNNMKTYENYLRSWTSTAACRTEYRRQPIQKAYVNPSKMIYEPGREDTPRASPTRDPREFEIQDYKLPKRPDLEYEIGVIKNESHYQNGPDTYLLQLRDPDFPARLRQYMKVAASRSPSFAIQMQSSSFVERNLPVIRERRRFTDIMDEEVDEERKNRISHYGDGPWNSEPRRLRHEIGTRMDTSVEAELELSWARNKYTNEPFIRDRPETVIYYKNGGEVEVNVTVAVGGGERRETDDTDVFDGTTVQWFKNDLVLTETSSSRIKLVKSPEQVSPNSQLHTLQITSMEPYDAGLYKIVVRNKSGSCVAKFRIANATAEGSQNVDVHEKLNYSWELNSDSLNEAKISDFQNISKKGSFELVSKGGKTFVKRTGVNMQEIELLKKLRHVCIGNLEAISGDTVVQDIGGFNADLQGDIFNVLCGCEWYSENVVEHVISQVLGALEYMHWRGYAMLCLTPDRVVVTRSYNAPSCLPGVTHETLYRVKIIDFNGAQCVQKIGSSIDIKSIMSQKNLEFLAPELISSESDGSAIHGPQADLWSVGVLIYYLLSGVLPFHDASETTTRQNITFVRFRFEFLFKDVTQEVTRLLMHIFKRSPLKRPACTEDMYEHRWMMNTEFMAKKREKARFTGDMLRKGGV